MNTKTLSPRAMSVIEQYLHFRIGAAACSVPYFNNKTVRAKMALRAFVGKGSPKDIFDEAETFMVKNHLPAASLADESLKKILVDENIGIDCSGFAYYVLNAESEEMKKGSISKHASFVNCHGLLGKMRCSVRPAENCDVATLANDKNSSIVPLNEIRPGDMITMTGSSAEAVKEGGFVGSERDHILVIHQVEYQNFVPYQLHYSHAVAYPEDGIYGSGVKQGVIAIVDINRVITAGKWSEGGKEGETNRIFMRAQRSKTEVRRLRWMK